MPILTDTSANSTLAISLPLYSVPRRYLDIVLPIINQTNCFPNTFLKVDNVLWVEIDSLQNLILNYNQKNSTLPAGYEEISITIASAVTAPFTLSLEISNIGYKSGYISVSLTGSVTISEDISDIDWSAPASSPNWFLPASLQIGILNSRTNYSLTLGSTLDVSGDDASVSNEWYSLAGYQGLDTQNNLERVGWTGAYDPNDSTTYSVIPSDIRSLVKFPYAKPSSPITGNLYGVNWSSTREPATYGFLEPYDYEAYLGFNAPSTSNWTTLTNAVGGKSHPVSRYSVQFGESFSSYTTLAASRNTTPLYLWKPDAISPTAIANTSAFSGVPTDKIIGDAAAYLSQQGWCFMALAPFPNSPTYSWCPFSINGSMNRGFGISDYINMWRRIHTIFGGGSVSFINEELTGLGLPPLDSTAILSNGTHLSNLNTILPAVNAAWLWSVNVDPNTYSVLNRYEYYFPGDNMVNWVGTELTYDPAGFTLNQQQNIEFFYSQYCRKAGYPFALESYSLTVDNPQYLEDLISWIEGHPKAKMAVYDNTGATALSNFPNTTAAYSGLVDGNAHFPDVIEGD